MKIKLHNSLGKHDGSVYLFNDKIFLMLLKDDLYFNYRTDDGNYFLGFSTKTKRFRKCYGFGGYYKNPDPKWWKNFNWREMD